MTDLSGAARRLLEVTRRPASGEELSDAQAGVEAALWEAENPVPVLDGFTSFVTGPESTSPPVANQPVAAEPAPVDVSLDVGSPLPDPVVAALADPPVAASSDPSSEPQTDSSDAVSDAPAAA